MSALAKAMSEEEIKQAAEYYAAMRWTPWIRVVEADSIPEAHLEQGGMYIIKGKEPVEPLGNRIVEAPEDDYQANTVRNPRFLYSVVYVPVGSLEKGRQLVLNGLGKTIACGTCHGPTLEGLVNIPGIASRSPSYMMRQMWDMKMGTRRGPMTQLMKPVVANLTQDDMLNVVAFWPLDQASDADNDQLSVERPRPTRRGRPTQQRAWLKSKVKKLAFDFSFCLQVSLDQ